MIRGGMADETLVGAMYNLGVYEANPPAYSFVVNDRYLDGESDIFTAVFNGRSVNFILRYQDGVEAIPLEPSNVKIKCLPGEKSSILGWEITDEEGNRYIFMQTEWSSVTREGTVETNSLRETFYISSWYLSQVFPVNKPLIEYEYYKSVNPNSWFGDNILIQKIITRSTVNYIYGEPIIEHPYDFSKYKNDFDGELRNAYLCFHLDNDDYYLLLRRNGVYNSMNDMYFNASLNELLPERIMRNMKTMGMLYDLTYVDQAYQELIRILDEMIHECKMEFSSDNIRQAIFHLERAKNIVIDCRNEVDEVDQKYVYQYGCQTIKSPMLKKISSANSTVEFEYRKEGSEDFSLNKVIVRDVNNDSIKSIHLYRSDPDRKVLDEIASHDKDGKKVSNIKFDYYGFVSDRVIVNIHGYYIGFSGPLSDYNYKNGHRFYDGYDGNTMNNSLKTIKMSSGADIELYYESNTCDLLLNDNGKRNQVRHVFGGIRIACLRIVDKLSGKTDDILYNYVYGTYVLPELVSSLKINYPGGFKDWLIFDRLYNPGPDAYVKTGNNGIYYSRVWESFRGKGTVQYNFVVPDTSSATYNYWEIGNPLGTCFYNEKGCLRKVIRYEYDEELALAGRKYFTQIKPCEYYVAEDALVRKYGGDPYFEDNMRKRLRPVLPTDQTYRISCGYTTFLKRISEYYFEGDSSFPSDKDGAKESPCYMKTEFDYDISRSTFPIKKTVTTSDGTTSIEIVKRALDFDDGTDASIALLKEKNMVGVPLKVQSKVLESDGTERLLFEQVNRYEKFGQEWDYNMLLAETNEYACDGKSEERTGSLFGFDRAIYDKTTILYAGEQNVFFPVAMERQGGRTEIRYDSRTGNRMLEVPFALENSVAVCDYRRFDDLMYKPLLKLPNALAIKYKLVVLTTSPNAGKVTLAIKKSGATLNREFSTRANYRGPQIFDLDLTSVAGIEEISLSGKTEELEYIMLVPFDREFSAASYNADGTVYCKFDHNGQAERYEYDGSGRVIRTFDGDGNLLKENSYNVVIR